MPESESNSPSQPVDSAERGNYVVVARRYRPRSFDELVGQQHVGRALKNAIETSRVGHAYLFTGARGVGKTSTARIFAKALNNPSGPCTSPDQDSDVAQAIDSGEDVDVIEIDGASNRGIDEIRSLRANIGVRPSRSRFKIYIIDEVHMLTAAAFNALLKTLEEPPEHVKFIFCTTDPEKIPITVLSRCQRFDFAPVEIQEIVARLRFIIDSEQAEADDEALELIARRAAGSMRDSQSLLEQVLSFSNRKLTADQVHAMLGTANDERLHALAQALADRDAASALKQMDAGIDAGVDAGRLAEQLLGYFRDLMAVTVGCDASMLRHTSVSFHQPLKELGQQWGLQTVLAVVGLIDQTLVRIRHSVYARVLLEATLIQICNLPDLQQIADLAAAAQGASGGGTTSGTSPTPRGGEKKKGDLTPSPASAPVAATSDAAVEPAHVEPAHVEPARSSGAATAAAIHGSQAPSLAGPHLASRQSPPQQAVGVSSTAIPGVSPSATSGQEGAVERSASGPAVSAQPARPAATALATSETSAQPWTQAQAEKVWRQALQNLESMTESFARVVDRVEAIGTHTLKLVFPHDGGLARRRCETPEHKTALTEAVSQAAGRSVTLEYALGTAPAPQRPTEPVVAKPSRVQRMREIESNPLVKSCVELFDAEIVRIDKPR